MKNILHSLGLSLLVFSQLSIADVCDRSKTLILTLEKATKKSCKDIDAGELAKITELEVVHHHIPAFKENDFVGLTNLKKLHFFSLFHKRIPGNEMAISEKVFLPLSNMEELMMVDDQYGRLPDGVFSGLTSLKILDLSDAVLLNLPASMLTLPKLEEVYYDGSGMPPQSYTELKKRLGAKLKEFRP